ncbi:MAG: aldo/keto reductase [Rubritepida sp.]|nr:aldo/keto reductase [Rubritepida sp.]
MLQTRHLTMPAIGLGTWPMKGGECEAAIGTALEIGYRHFDTAEMYGNEVEVGRALAGTPRDQYFLTSKAWWDKQDGAAIRAACQASLDRLGTGYLDLYLIHWPSPQLDLPDALEGLARIQADGLARAVGVANFPSALLRQALALNIAPLACDQVEHHALLPQAPLLAVTGPADMVLTSYTPLGKGEVPAHPVFGPIAAKHGATRAQVALAWAMAQGRVAVIPKAASAARQLENFGASRVALDAADIAAISAIQTRKRFVDPAFAPEWDV